MTPPPPRSTLFPYTTLFRSFNRNRNVVDFRGLRSPAFFARELNVKRRHKGLRMIGDRTKQKFDLLPAQAEKDRKSTRLNSSHRCISYAVFCLKKKKKIKHRI